MKALLVSTIAAVGALFATIGTSACPVVWIDEPKMPKCLIEK